MRKKLIIFLLIGFHSFSCQDGSKKNTGTLDPQVNPEMLLSDFKTWWGYHNKFINLSSDFIGLSSQSDTLSKEIFLQQLASGNYIPLRLKPAQGREIYKLFKFNVTEFESIGETIKDESFTTQFHFKMEGMTFPDFDLVDLNGNHYNNELAKGKVLVLKTWFIGSTACIKEFPELNNLVEEYSEDEDILFISLALHSEADLENFLSKKPFKYEVVAKQKELIVSELGLNAYPTHLVVDANGEIIKVVDSASEMISFLKQFMPPQLPPPPPTA